MDKKSSNDQIKKKNGKDINKRAELEKELNIQRNHKNRKKGPQLSDMKMNQLNYYNEIAKNNIHNLMNNPTIKDIIRITENESVFDQLKVKEQSKDLSKFLDILPLKRVERINYKNLEIGNMRKDLGIIKNPNVNYNKEKGQKFAGNLYEKRKRQGSVNYIPVLTIDNIHLYNQKNKKNCNQSYNKTNINKNKNNLTVSNNESWFKKYKRNAHNAKNIKKGKNIEYNRYNNQTEIIKYYKDNSNLTSTKIEVNKNKNNFDNEDLNIKKNKKINSLKPINLTVKNKIIINNNDLNESNDNKYPKRKRKLTTNLSTKINRIQNVSEKNIQNNQLKDIKTINGHNCFSNSDLFNDNSISEIKKQNVKRSFLNNVKNYNIGEIKVKKRKIK